MTSKNYGRSALRRTLTSMAASCCLLVAAAPTQAKNLPLLIRVLYAIDLAEMLTNVCRLADPSFLKPPIGPVGGVADYQLHIKGEVLAGLDPTEADQVLHMAADRARDEARQDFKSFATGDGRMAGIPMASWCAEEAAPFVRKVIGGHDHFHVDIDHLLAEAKRNGNPEF